MTILDLFSRFTIGWAVSAVNDRHLALKALDMALKRRCPDKGLLHHSDQGSPYASEDYQLLLDVGLSVWWTSSETRIRRTMVSGRSKRHPRRRFSEQCKQQAVRILVKASAGPTCPCRSVIPPSSGETHRSLGRGRRLVSFYEAS